MTRFIKFSVLIISLTSCQKAEINLGTDFHRIVGKWENVEGDDRVHVSVQKNGKIEISKSTERGNRLKVNQVIKELNGQNINGTIWDRYDCYEVDKNQNIIKGFSYTINLTNDTILLYATGTPILNFTINDGELAYTYKRIE